MSKTQIEKTYQAGLDNGLEETLTLTAAAELGYRDGRSAGRKAVRGDLARLCDRVSLARSRMLRKDSDNQVVLPE